MSDTHDRPRLLLVDDDATFCEVLARALERRGFSVHVALNLETAVTAAEALHPEYALIDLCIGNDSGLPLVRELGQMNPQMRIVVLTGFASVATAVEAIKLGVSHYLTKPADPDEIVAAFHRDEGDAGIPLERRPLSARRAEWEHIQKVLHEHEGNISAAARAMGMHRRTLQRKLRKRPTRQ